MSNKLHSRPPKTICLQIQPYNSIQVKYESKVDWREYQDILYCSPEFHDKPQYDFVIVKTAARDLYAQLLFLFTCDVGDTFYAIALVLLFDAPIASNQGSRKDADLVFRCCRVQSRNKAEFISARSIIRGTALVKDFDRQHEYLVLDTLDADMYLRTRPDTVVSVLLSHLSPGPSAYGSTHRNGRPRVEISLMAITFCIHSCRMTEVFDVVVIMIPMHFITAPSFGLDFTCARSPKVLHNRAGRSVKNILSLSAHIKFRDTLLYHAY